MWFENVKENVPSNPSLKFVHNFDWRIKISNMFLEMKISLIYQLYSKFLGKSYYAMPK